MKLSKLQLNTLTAIQKIAEGHDANEAVKQTLKDKLDKVLVELARDPSALSVFFAALELSATTAAARVISTHVMRPDEVTNLVKKRRAEIANKKAKKASSVQSKDDNN